MKNLALRLDSDAEWWQHSPGDKLVGRLVDRDTYYPKPDPTTGKVYDPYPTVTVLVEEPGSTENGGEPIPVGAERIFGARRSIPRDEIEKKDPQVGDMIGIAYRGIPEERMYHFYKILVDRAARPEPVDEPAETEEGGDAGDDIPF
jgi:hypothetical protein